MKRITPGQKKVISAIRAARRAGKPLSYRALRKIDLKLVSLASHHFGSWKNAIEASGIDYKEISRKPLWTKERVIRLLKQAKKRGRDLNWTTVIARNDPLAKAAYAAISKRMFGSWARALSAAGVDPDTEALYIKWDRESIVWDIRQLDADGSDLGSREIQLSEPRLHAAAIRHFGSWKAALKAAGV
ncbi:MAG TPA: hypothetical protein PK402_00340 [Tepidisphaeraceae bacterium]|nr:hypothetical protein [Tepidisphaeraceae bacterium]